MFHSAYYISYTYLTVIFGFIQPGVQDLVRISLYKSFCDKPFGVNWDGGTQEITVCWSGGDGLQYGCWFRLFHGTKQPGSVIQEVLLKDCRLFA